MRQKEMTQIRLLYIFMTIKLSLNYSFGSLMPTRLKWRKKIEINSVNEVTVIWTSDLVKHMGVLGNVARTIKLKLILIKFRYSPIEISDTMFKNTVHS